MISSTVFATWSPVHSGSDTVGPGTCVCLGSLTVNYFGAGDSVLLSLVCSLGSSVLSSYFVAFLRPSVSYFGVRSASGSDVLARSSVVFVMCYFGISVLDPGFMFDVLPPLARLVCGYCRSGFVRVFLLCGLPFSCP